MPTTPTREIDQRSAGVAGIDRGIGLDHLPTIQGTDHAGGDGAVEAERRADGDHRLADSQALADPEARGGQLPAGRPEHGDSSVRLLPTTSADTRRPVDRIRVTSSAPATMWWLAIRLAPERSTITVGVGSRQGWVWVSVADQGPGITAEDRLRVFDRFHRGAESPGTGLGLAIARQVVESHDGRLLLADTPGPGSTFVIWLPERAIAGAPERGTEPPVGDPTT
ncbi:MAG TPA: ATP-binding protein [Microlunatus sp.]|nr:ATP-binding protein [Microlunatus sp.]